MIASAITETANQASLSDICRVNITPTLAKIVKGCTALTNLTYVADDLSRRLVRYDCDSKSFPSDIPLAQAQGGELRLAKTPAMVSASESLFIPIKGEGHNGITALNFKSETCGQSKCPLRAAGVCTPEIGRVVTDSGKTLTWGMFLDI